MTIPATTGGTVKGQQAQQTTTGKDAYSNMNTDAFMKMLVTELQNQDPMNPMSNSELVQQVSQIRAIESNTRLTETLQSVLLGQNVSTAASLLDRTITGIDAKSEKVTGKVDRVSITDGEAKVFVGDHAISLKNVGEIVPAKS